MTRTFKHFTIKERYTISHMRFTEKNTLQAIAEILGKSKSSISMEINRNKVKGLYIPAVSNIKYQDRLHKKDAYKIKSNPALYDYIFKRR